MLHKLRGRSFDAGSRRTSIRDGKASREPVTISGNAGDNAESRENISSKYLGLYLHCLGLRSTDMDGLPKPEQASKVNSVLVHKMVGKKIRNHQNKKKLQESP